MENFLDKRQNPYFLVANDIFVTNLTIFEKLVYIYLCRCSSSGSKAFPSYADIAEKCSCSKNTAINAINGLIEKGCIGKKNRKTKKNEYTSNLYFLYDIPAEIIKLKEDNNEYIDIPKTQANNTEGQKNNTEGQKNNTKGQKNNTESQKNNTESQKNISKNSNKTKNKNHASLEPSEFDAIGIPSDGIGSAPHGIPIPPDGKEKELLIYKNINNISINHSNGIYNIESEEKHIKSNDDGLTDLLASYGITKKDVPGITKDDIENIIFRMKGKKIKNPRKYFIRTYANLQCEKNINKAISSQKSKSESGFVAPKNFFNSYSQRKYDVAELERRLLARSYGDEE